MTMVGPIVKTTKQRNDRAWIAIFVGIALIGVWGLPLWTLYVVAAGAGFAMGGVWAAGRPLMLRLTPPARIGEFYGLYGMVGRFSAITGPALWAFMTWLTIQVFGLAPRVGQGIGVLVLLVLVIASSPSSDRSPTSRMRGKARIWLPPMLHERHKRGDKRARSRKPF